MNERGIADGIEMSGVADVSAATVSLYLSGKRGRRMNSQAVKTVEKLAGALGVEPEYFREYREWKAKHLIEEAMAAGLIDLEDIELILAGKRYQGSKNEGAVQDD